METVTLTLNQEQVQIIAAALNELPGRICNPMLGLINSQIAQQIAAEQEVAEGVVEAAHQKHP